MLLLKREILLSKQVQHPNAMMTAAGWKTVSLGDIADVKLGKMLDKSKHITGSKLPYLRNVNVRWGSVDTSDLLEDGISRITS